MRGEPGGADLLAIAAETLKESVIPALSGDARYRALMVANALRIASRELTGRNALSAAEAACATALVEGIAGMRRGIHDGDPDLHHRLHTLAVAATAITRPAALAEDERKRAGLDAGDG